jgi:hypothetical protein
VELLQLKNVTLLHEANKNLEIFVIKIWALLRVVGLVGKVLSKGFVIFP